MRASKPFWKNAAPIGRNNRRRQSKIEPTARFRRHLKRYMTRSKSPIWAKSCRSFRIFIKFYLLKPLFFIRFRALFPNLLQSVLDNATFLPQLLLL